MSNVILGIDLGMNSCNVVGLNEDSTVIIRRRMRLDGLVALAAKLIPCVGNMPGIPRAVRIATEGND